MKERTGEGRVQIDTEHGRGSVENGFSGGAVYDTQENAVVGILVSVDSYGDDVRAYMIPADTILKAFPYLGVYSRPRNPYKGLSAFTEEDCDFFFGREQATEELYQEFKQKPFICVLGASGSGKSSLVFAGLIPLLRAKENGLLILTFRPQQDAFKHLTLALLPFLYQDRIDQAEQLDKLQVKLQNGEVKLSSLLTVIAPQRPSLLIIDQFEELFTHQNSALQQSFLSCLLELLSHNVNVKILITLRADFMGLALAQNELASTLKLYPSYLLTVMSQKESKAAIEQPANRLHVTFEDGLINHIVKELGTEAGRLPLMQFALMQLWEKQHYSRLSFSGYQEIGGLEQSIIFYADDVWQSFQHDKKKQARMRYVLVQLVRPGLGTEDTRQVVLRSEMDQDLDLVKELADKRLVVTAGDETQQTVEIVHEVLIRHWSRMQEWLREDRGFREWQDNLRLALNEWKKDQDRGSLLRGVKLAVAEANLKTYAENLNPNEKAFIKESIDIAGEELAEREQQRRRIIIGLSVFLSVVTALAVFAGWQWHVAKVRTKEVVTERNNAFYKQSLFLADLSQQETESGRAQNGILLALEALPKDMLNPDKPYVFEVESALYKALVNYHKHTDFIGHQGAINDIVFSPDGRFIASASSDKTARVWDSITGKTVQVLQGHTAAVNAIDFSHDSKTIITVSSDGTARLWDRQTGKQLNILIIGKSLNKVKFSIDGKLALISSVEDNFSYQGTGLATVWEIGTDKIILSLQNIDTPAFDVSGKYLATSNGAAVTIWDVNTGRKLFISKIKEAGIIKFSPDSQYLAIGAEIGEPAGLINLIVWNLKTGGQVKKEMNSVDDEYGATIQTLEFSPDSKSITGMGLQQTEMTSNYNNIIFSYDISEEKLEWLDEKLEYPQISKFIKATGEDFLQVTSNAISIDGYIENYTVDISDRRPNEVSIDDEQEILIQDFVSSPDGELLLRLRDNSMILLSSDSFLAESEDIIKTNKFATNLDKYKQKVDELKNKLSESETISSSFEICAVSSNGKKAVACIFKSDFALIDMETGKVFEDLTRKGLTYDWVLSAMFSLDDNYLITSEADTITLEPELWDVWRAFPSTQDLIDFARQIVPQQLTQEQRKEFYLDYDEKSVVKTEQKRIQINKWKHYLDEAESNELSDKVEFASALKAYQDSVSIGNALVENYPVDSTIQKIAKRSENLKIKLDNLKKSTETDIDDLGFDPNDDNIQKNAKQSENLKIEQDTLKGKTDNVDAAQELSEQVAPKAPSFDCSKAKKPTDITVCGNPKLVDFDVKNMQFYKKAKAINAATTKAILIVSIKSKYACGTDVGCIEGVYKKSIVNYGTVATGKTLD